MKKTLLAFFFLSFIAAQTQTEKHWKTLEQLTFGGDNAEAYFSPQSDQFCFQSNFKKWGADCDQIFLYQLQSGKRDSNFIPKRISSGKGRTTCSYFLPNGKNILYASTFLSGDSCPLVVHIKGKYLWPVYESYEIFVADLKGKIVKQLTRSPGYDAEATVSPNGDKIVFTSTRSGDLELWTMDLNGENLKQLTFELGYDGGAFFSPDGKEIVFRASRPTTEVEITEYKDFLKKGLVAPSKLEIFVCNADGSNMRQITHLGKANWAPFFHPSGKKIIFSSNHHSDKGYDFQLFMIHLDGTGLEQITSESNFNAFPMFSPDGKRLIFSSNRNNGGTHDTNLFIADWKD